MCNFDQIIQRRGTNSYKWDTPERADVLPMWVADMDFQTAPCIISALQERVGHGIFGYTRVPQSYYESVARWFSRRHQWLPATEWMLYTSGVVPALSATIKALTSRDDRVVVLTPVYNCFFSSIRNNGCMASCSPLVQRDGNYRIDFDDLDSRTADPRAKLMLLCNPHNPGGRVWTRDELQRVAAICRKNNVTVVADEIHCELTFDGHDYTPFASVVPESQLDQVVTCVSPSKAFNTAGLQIATIIARSEEVRERIDRAININEVCDVNPFGIVATEAAYSAEGAEWLDELRAYLWQNYLTLQKFFAERLPKFPVFQLEGTYLAWIDCSCVKGGGDRVAQQLLSRERLMLSAGSMYGSEGANFVRLNLACPRSVLLDALQRMERELAALV